MSKGKTDPSLEEKDEFWKKLVSIHRHIRNVQDTGFLLAQRLKDEGELELALALVTVVQVHDNSKYTGVEWNFMDSEDPEMRMIAISQHRSVNPHHPEFHLQITSMTELQIAELVCDLKARSQEMGTDLRAYIRDDFLPRYKLKTQSVFYRKMKRFVDLLLDDPMTYQK